MSTRIYALPIEQTRWQVPSGSTTVFDWEYDEGRDRMLGLYEKGKQRQWDAAERLDWSIEVDHNDPMGVPEQTIAIYGSRVWDSLGPKERGMVRHHLASWQFSQFLHGEQGALICSAKIVHTVPELDAKFYAATQVVDEARHVEVYSRYLREKLDLAYPINPGLKALLNDVISDSRWDMTYLGMQVLIEGLALAAFGLIRDNAVEPLAKALNTYVMQDESRHVAFGRLALREYYPINPGLKALLNDVISDSRWDMTYLGMQVLIEGLALAAFGLIRDNAVEPLAKALNTYVMQDESRHVAFGRLALREYYPQLTQAERDEREEFCIEACHMMQERFIGEEVWRNLDIDADECMAYMRASDHFRAFQSHLFSRIVPTLSDIGLFGDKMKHAFGEMGVIGYEKHDIEAMMDQDEKIASDLDRARIEQVEEAITLGAED